jgi:hypothetical protein
MHSISTIKLYQAVYMASKLRCSLVISALACLWTNCIVVTGLLCGINRWAPKLSEDPAGYLLANFVVGGGWSRGVYRLRWEESVVLGRRREEEKIY